MIFFCSRGKKLSGKQLTCDSPQPKKMISFTVTKTTKIKDKTFNNITNNKECTYIKMTRSFYHTELFDGAILEGLFLSLPLAVL